MNPVLIWLLIRLYPRKWRARYGEEFEALLEDSPSSLRASANVACSAIREHIVPTQGGNMNQDSRAFGAIIRNPSALIPMARALTALAVVLGHIAMGIKPLGFLMIAPN